MASSSLQESALQTRLNVMQYIATKVGMGGMENHVLTLSRYLDPGKVRTTITCLPLEENAEEFFRRAAEIGVPVNAFPTGKRDALAYVKRTASLARLLQRERIDVLHIHAAGFTGLNAFVAARMAGVRAIVVTHHTWYGPVPHSRSGHLSLWLERRLASRVVALYSEQGRDLVSAGIPPRRIMVVPNGVDLSRFTEVNNTESDSGSGFRIAIVARLVEGKGHEELLRAVQCLVDRYPQLRLRIVGDGPARERIEALVQQLGLVDVVEMLGSITNEQVRQLLTTCHAIALPSYWSGEVFPLSIIEGMATGLPAIGTRFVGIPDIIEDGEVGLLVEPRDVDQLVGALEKLLANPKYAAEMGRRARMRAQHLFSAETMGQTMLDLYKEAVADAAKGQKSHRQNYRSKKAVSSS